MSRPSPIAQEGRRPGLGVLGLWHLGSVTAACLAEAGNEVIGIDPDPTVVAGLAAGRPPVYEPGLAELIARGAERLRFSGDPRALAQVTRAWVTFDTPVDEDDHADVEWVLARSAELLAHLPAGALVIVSSQLPVGSIARLQARCSAVRGDGGPRGDGEPRGEDGSRGDGGSRSDGGLRGAGELRFACVPENLRLGGALESFRTPERIVAGVRSEQDRRELAELLAPFSTNVLWMRVESAEMLKHSLNGFLATSIAFVNEIASICESVDADAEEVSRGLRSDPRIGPRAYLNPGDAFAGGTLARDVGFLQSVAEHHGLTPHVSAGVARGNAAHRGWTRRKLLELLGVEQEHEHAARPLAGRTVAVWGLTYKPGTDTLRRSGAVELCRWLARAGARVRAHDPVVHALPASLSGTLELCPSPLEAAAGAQALVVCTACPEFQEVSMDELIATLARPAIVDPAGWLAGGLAAREGVRYARVGVPVSDTRQPRHALVAEGSS
ncbi:MAG: UDP binding domain-containing protein [Solirubrobacterales bacterium]